MSTARVGLFGGTFDPPHLGHLVVATHARRLLGLSRVLWVVANDPWQKAVDRPPSPAEIRLEMVRAAVDGLEGQDACGIEIERGGPSYTLDTVRELEVRLGEAELVLLLGRDAAAGLASWKGADELRRLVEVAVVGRPGFEDRPLPDGWRTRRVEVPMLELSSTDLRARFGDGRPLDVIVQRAVVAVARDHALYGGGR
jgi:nicotinate-nucleotide adenylyltransferase